jgi:hypothetical protein
MRMGFVLRLAAAAVLAGASLAGAQEARAQVTSPSPMQAQSDRQLGWGWTVRGGAVHQFGADVDDGGSFDATRATLDGSVRYAFSEGTFVGLSAGYGYDHYGFSGDARIGGLSPWDQVHNVRLSLPLFWEPTPDWQILAIPRLRMTAEEPEDLGDGLTGGAILGFSYRFSDRLRVGPGFGFTTELEESLDFFPILVVDWQVTDRLRIETGRSLGTTRGPGLLASYEIAKNWRASVGFRREKLRFRLGDGGVGEDRSFPVVAGITWGPPYAELSLFAGAELGGELRLEDSDGNTLAESDYDPAAIVGLNFRLRF